ncbi:TRAP transporter substrate-binding protein [Pleomorphochaeta sp. DL1XJH-081]|uniref:TRAP transporter substrate-binding protein n=1 Tax=Pleomorphochaeta sp. DL1XJH-081 TaxID=3409690 RepID=UPI003BB4B802
MKTKKIVAILVLSLVALTVIPSMLFAAGQAESSVTTLKVANYFAADHPLNKNLEEVFKKTVEAETDLVVEIYPANQLGAEPEFTEGVMIGNIEMAVTGNMWEMYNEEISFVQLPYIFTSMDHAYDTMNGELGRKVYEELFRPIGIDVLGFFSQGGRALSNNVRPINSPADTSGITMRTWQGTTIIEIMERFGFDVTVMSMDELFTALQQGVVDAQDNPISATYHQGWFEVLDYVSVTNHIISPNYFVINAKVFDGLSENDREVVARAAAATTEKTHKDILGDEQRIVDLIQDEMGVEVLYPNVTPFMEKVLPMIDAFKEKFPEVRDLIEEIQESGKSYL